jgi:hypothetical protein
LDGAVEWVRGLKPGVEDWLFAGVEEAAEKGWFTGKKPQEHPSAAKAGVNFAGLLRGLKPPPPSDESLSAACESPASLRREFFRSM